MALPVHCSGEAELSVVFVEDVWIGISGGTWGAARNFCILLTNERALLSSNLRSFFRKVAHGMVLQLDFYVSQCDDGTVYIRVAVAQLDHLGGESRVCRFYVAGTGFIYQTEKLGFRQ